MLSQQSKPNDYIRQYNEASNRMYHISNDTEKPKPIKSDVIQKVTANSQVILPKSISQKPKNK